jgi:DNA-binding MarR family transcriptional regulator
MPKPASQGTHDGYALEDQVGFLLRQAYQRHSVIFAECFEDSFTTTQWAVIAKLAEVGECSQNLLGRQTAMDVATIKGVVERLAARKLVTTHPDPADKRRLTISLLPAGKRAYEKHLRDAERATEATLAPLTPAQRQMFIELLRQLLA